ncbi:hypothetical protein ACOSQ4_018691 [Xanthoceras sorbifolium]
MADEKPNSLNTSMCCGGDKKKNVWKNDSYTGNYHPFFIAPHFMHKRSIGDESEKEPLVISSRANKNAELPLNLVPVNYLQ